MTVSGLLEQYAPRVFRFLFKLCGDRHLAEDMTQETLLRAWRGVGQLGEPSKLTSWVFRIAMNVWRDAQRRRRRHPTVSLAGIDPAADKDRPDRVADARDMVAQAFVALDALPRRQREVLYLQAVEGLGIDEIASVLGIGTGAVKSSLSIARRRLREQFGPPPDGSNPPGSSVQNHIPSPTK